MDASIINNLPTSSGVYLFSNNEGDILYIGKAKNIRTRVRSHFRSASNGTGNWANFYSQVSAIDTIPTPTEKDALILEAKLVRIHQPKYNIELKDDKGFFYVSFSGDPLPRVTLIHRPPLKRHPRDNSCLIGPLVNGKELKRYLHVLRRLFPYRTCSNPIDRACLYHDMGLCSAHGSSARRYAEVLHGLRTMLLLYAGKKPRIEGYDISNTQGSLSVGSMVVFSGSRPKKSDYRKFRVRGVSGSNDPASLKEIFTRRLAHTEWPTPDLILIDGGKSQLSRFRSVAIPLLTLAKTKTTSSRSKTAGVLWSPYGSGGVSLSSLPDDVRDTLLRVRDESHRFAITYHRKRQQHILSE